MISYKIVPRAPLVFRSGKPFGAGGSDGANFPWPSSVAGMMRTVAWDQDACQADPQELLGIEVLGPLLGRRHGAALTPMVPKPADALYMKDEATGCVSIKALVPGRVRPGCGSDLPTGLRPVVFAGQSVKGKPQSGPQYWSLSQFLAWRRGEALDFSDIADVFVPGEARTHVALDRRTLAADAGRLFQTEGLDFGPARQERGYGSEDWVLLARCQRELAAQFINLGGERRLSWLEPLAQDALDMPSEHAVSTEKVRHLALTLATPALFSAGWKPGWLNEGAEGLEGDVPGVAGLRLRLWAAAVERWQGVSGWDLRQKQPKPARKAVSAGATYWFEILGEPPAGWIQALWLASICDAAQDRRDGWGVVVPGPWTDAF